MAFGREASSTTPSRPCSGPSMILTRRPLLSNGTTVISTPDATIILTAVSCRRNISSCSITIARACNSRCEMRAEQRVAERDACVGERAAIDHEAVELRVDEGRDFVDERAFMIRLEELELSSVVEFRPQRLFKIGESRAAVNLRLAFAKPV